MWKKGKKKLFLELKFSKMKKKEVNFDNKMENWRRDYIVLPDYRRGKLAISVAKLKSMEGGLEKIKLFHHAAVKIAFTFAQVLFK